MSSARSSSIFSRPTTPRPSSKKWHPRPFGSSRSPSPRAATTSTTSQATLTPTTPTCSMTCSRRRLRGPPSDWSRKRSPDGGNGGWSPSRSCPATTSKATATSPAKRSPPLQRSRTRNWAPGSRTMFRSPTAWWTGSPPSPRTRTVRPSPRNSGSRTLGRWCANRLSSGSLKTISASGALPSKTPESSSWTTSNPTN